MLFLKDALFETRGRKIYSEHLCRHTFLIVHTKGLHFSLYMIESFMWTTNHHLTFMYFSRASENMRAQSVCVWAMLFEKHRSRKLLLKCQQFWRVLSSLKMCGSQSCEFRKTMLYITLLSFFTGVVWVLNFFRYLSAAHPWEDKLRPPYDRHSFYVVQKISHHTV